jgi:hypothetical protein
MGRRFVAACIIGLSACHSTAPAMADMLDAVFGTRWRWAESVDPISDAPVRQAYVATVDIAGRLLGTDESRVLLTCVDGKASITIDWSFRVAGSANLVVEYRFDGRPGRSLKARYVNRTRQQSADIGDVRLFLSDARQATRLFVRVDSDLYGPSSATFAAAAGPDMVRRFVAACPAAG